MKISFLGLLKLKHVYSKAEDDPKTCTNKKVYKKPYSNYMDINSINTDHESA
jgi:ribosome biogenesis protein Tsr3